MIFIFFYWQMEFEMSREVTPSGTRLPSMSPHHFSGIRNISLNEIKVWMKKNDYATNEWMIASLAQSIEHGDHHDKIMIFGILRLLLRMGEIIRVTLRKFNWGIQPIHVTHVVIADVYGDYYKPGSQFRYVDMIPEKYGFEKWKIERGEQYWKLNRYVICN